MATTSAPSIHAGSPTYEALSARYEDDRMPAADAAQFVRQHSLKAFVPKGAAVLYIQEGHVTIEYVGTDHGYVDISDLLDALGY